MNDFLNQAIALGKPNIQKVAPNPAVGEILVKNGKIIGKGAYKKPYVLLKTAMSVDGKIAAIDGGFVKFSNQQDKQAVHKLRASMDAILIGGNTLLWDNPKLTLRDKRLIQERIKNNLPAQPYKIAVIGNAEKVNIKSRFFTYGDGRRIIFTTARTSKKKIAELKKAAYVYVSKTQKIDLRKMILICQKQGVRRILLEGGGTLHFNMLKAGLVDELRLAVAPIIIGGKNTPTLVDGEGFIKYPKLKFKKQEHFGEVKVFWYEIDKRKK